MTYYSVTWRVGDMWYVLKFKKNIISLCRLRNIVSRLVVDL